MRIRYKNLYGGSIYMKKKVLALLTAFALIGTPSVFAQTEGSGEDDGNQSKVNIVMDNQYFNELGAPNLMFNGYTYVPLKAFAESIGAFIQDLGSSTVKVVKPNVNLIVSENKEINKTNDRFSITPFSAVTKGQTKTPHIYFAIDNAPLTKELYSRIVVLDPSKDEVSMTQLNVINTEKKGTDLVGIVTLDKISFDKSGNYTVQFLMKVKGNYIKVGQTLIKSN